MPSKSPCPYCDTANPELTDDHVFPQFLGSRRTIKVCRVCNNTFGHTFEGAVSRQLKRMQVFISHFGLDLARIPAAWPSAIVVDDVTYDLASGPEGVQYLLSKPIVLRDSEGKITGGKARSRSEAERISAGVIKAGHAKEIEITEEPGVNFDDMRLTGSFSFDGDLYRFAAKLTAAVLVAFGHKQCVSSSEIPAFLHGKRESLATPAYCDIAPIVAMRPPLAHTVYVELGVTSYGVVLLFGSTKLFVPLPPFSRNEAFLAILDPMTGEERFEKVTPIGPREVPALITEPEAMHHLREMGSILTQDAIALGAKHPPKLEIKNLDLSEPQMQSWTDSTARFMSLPKKTD